jgi:integrase
MPLTELAIRKAKPLEKPYKLSDSGGLFLYITPAGGKSWRWKYYVDGREKLMTLGLYPDVSLAQARERRDLARKVKAEGHDPMLERKLAQRSRKIAAENAFEAVAKAWLAQWSTDKSPRHVDYVLRRMEADVFPEIGKRPVSEIQAPELVAMVKKIAARGAVDIAKRAYQTCSQVFRYAVAHGLAQRNPAADVKPGDILPGRRQEHYSRVDGRELPALLRHIEAYQGSVTTRLAMKLMALTFVRTSELIGARWVELDLDAAEWRIPAERMKMRSMHIVPLAKQAIEVLKTLHIVTGSSELLFPGERNRKQPMSNNTILAALKRMGYQGRMTGHGFRGIASTILHEQGFDHNHIELQLAHTARDKVSAAYNHAKYLEKRAALMQHWADHLDNVMRGNVATGVFSRASSDHSLS